MNQATLCLICESTAKHLPVLVECVFEHWCQWQFLSLILAEFTLSSSTSAALGQASCPAPVLKVDSRRIIQMAIYTELEVNELREGKCHVCVWVERECN